MRDPSIHIKRSDLKRLITQFSKEHSGILTPKFKEELVEFLLTKGRLYSCDSRGVLVSNNKVEKKIKTLTLSSKDKNLLMAKCIKMFRLKLKHRNVDKITPEKTREWANLKKLTKDAVAFYESFHKEIPNESHAFMKYLEIGNQKMAKFNMMKYLSMFESICDTYEAILELEGDKDKQGTLTIHNFYQGMIMTQTGMDNDYRNHPDKYVYFKRVNDYCRERGIDSRLYIKAQFAGLGFRNGLPDPVQLVGDKAIQRLNKYAYEHKITLKKEPESLIDWSSIKG